MVKDEEGGGWTKIHSHATTPTIDFRSFADKSITNEQKNNNKRRERWQQLFESDKHNKPHLRLRTQNVSPKIRVSRKRELGEIL